MVFKRIYFSILVAFLPTVVVDFGQRILKFTGILQSRVSVTGGTCHSYNLLPFGEVDEY